MKTFERIFIVRPEQAGWTVSEGADNIAVVESQSGAIRCAAMAAITAQVKGYTATFRIDI